MFSIMVIGITGGIGSGKTAVCTLLEESGAKVFYADVEARRLMETDASVKAELRASFGAETWLEDGSLNRVYLAGEIFSSDDRRLQMNAIVHPAVRNAFAAFKQQQEKAGISLIVKEAALLFESGTGDLDAVVVVDASTELRIKRVVGRDKTTPEQVQNRIDGQLPASEMRDRADFVINNNGTTEALVSQVDALLRFLSGFDSRVPA
jgi:dephospho-CoA kinase